MYRRSGGPREDKTARRRPPPTPRVCWEQSIEGNRQPGGVRQAQGVRGLLSLPDEWACKGQLCSVPHSVPDPRPRLDVGGPQRPHQAGQRLRPDLLLRGRARARSSPAPRSGYPRRRDGGRGAASLGGRRTHECPSPPGQATRGERTRSGGTKCIRSDFDGSGRAGGSSPSTPATTAAYSERVASIAGLPTAGIGDGADLDLGAVGGCTRTASSAAGRRGALPGFRVVEPPANAGCLDGGAGLLSGPCLHG